MTAAGFAGLAPCVHCGFCLQSCPTFLVTGDESDSPRGRIVLMRALERGDLDASDPTLQLHLDRCLGCRACEPVCPSGVAYGGALEQARAMITARRPTSLIARLVLAVMADPLIRRPAMLLARLVRPLARWLAGGSRIGFSFGMLGSTVQGARYKVQGSAPAPFTLHPAPTEGEPVVVFEGCIMSGLFSHVNDATARTLAANGYDLKPAPQQGCCGALHAHAGEHEEALSLARANVRAFAGTGGAPIAVNSAGCGAMLKDYGRLLAADPAASEARAFSARVRDVTELLAARGPRAGARLEVNVAYDAPCHLLHAQRVADPPVAVLDAIPGLTRVPYAESDVCCGSAGIYSLLEPEMSRAVLARKTAALLASGADIVATGNPGCVMQIGAGLRAAGREMSVVHPVELLDRSYAAAGFYAELERAGDVGRRPAGPVRREPGGSTGRPGRGFALGCGGGGGRGPAGGCQRTGRGDVHPGIDHQRSRGAR